MLCKIVVLVSKEAHQFAIGAVGREVLAFGFLVGAHICCLSGPKGSGAYSIILKSTTKLQR